MRAGAILGLNMLAIVLALSGCVSVSTSDVVTVEQVEVWATLECSR